METITRKNREDVLGKSFFLSNEVSIIAKLLYIDGIDYFNDVLRDTSIKEIGAVIHIYMRKKGIEIRLTKQFKYFSVGIQPDEIKDITISNEDDFSYLVVKTKDEKIITFTLRNCDKKIVTEFFNNKIKVPIHELSQKTNIALDKDLLKIRTYKYRRMGNIEFVCIWLFMNIFLTSVIVLVTTLLSNPSLVYLYIPASIIVNVLISIYRLRDLNKSMYHIILTFLPIVSFYYLFIFIIRKGVTHDKLGKEILI